MHIAFGAYALDLDRRELSRAGSALLLEPKAFTVLAHLLTHRHRAVPKAELLVACWPGECVTEMALTRCVHLIRQAVGDNGNRQQVIKTLRGYGYRFVTSVETLPTPAAEGQPPVPAPGLPCPQCQTVNRAARQFCAACGQPLWQSCPQCGSHNSPHEHFCGGCDRAAEAVVPVHTST
jgi:DNA-binding winged helix-turn-helix (wHTH) protein